MKLPPGKPSEVQFPQECAPFVRGVMLHLMSEFVLLVPQLKVRVFHNQLISCLESVYGEPVFLRVWIRCLEGVYKLQDMVPAVKQHVVDVGIALLAYLAEDNRLSQLEADLLSLLTRLSERETLSAENVVALMETWPKTKETFSTVIIGWLASSVAKNSSLSSSLRPFLASILPLDISSQLLVKTLSITPEDIKGIRFNASLLQSYTILCRMPQLTDIVRSNVESYLQSLFPISTVTAFENAVKCCEILLKSGSSRTTDSTITNLVFAPLMSFSPRAAPFVKDRHGITLTVRELFQQRRLISHCLSLVAIFPETKVKKNVKSGMIRDACKRNELILPVIDNLHLYKEFSRDILTDLQSHRFNDEETARLAEKLAGLCCVLLGDQSCSCSAGETKLVDKDLGEIMAQYVMVILRSECVCPELRSKVIQTASYHIEMNQDNLDNLLEIFITQKSYLLRLGLVGAIYQVLKSDLMLRPYVDFTEIFYEENVDTYETGLMLVSRMLAARPALHANYFKYLMNAVCSKVFNLRVIGLSEVHWLSRHLGTSLKQILLDNRKTVAQCVYSSILATSTRTVEQVMEGVSNVFDAECATVAPCLNLLHRFLLPLLVAHGGEDAQQRVREIAKLSGNANLEGTQLKLIALIAKYLPQIVAYLFTHHSGAEKKCEVFLKYAFGADWRNYFTDGGPHKIIYELMTYLPSKEDGVKQGIRYVAHMRGRDLRDDEQIRDFVCEHQDLLGILFLYESNIRKASSDEKLQILTSLSQFIRFLGVQYVTKVRIKLLYVLRTAVSCTANDVELLQKCADAWFTFVRTLDKSGLPTIVGDLVMSIVPLLGTPELLSHARDILEYLLVANKACYADRLNRLSFILETDQLPSFVRHAFSAEKTKFKESLEISVANLSNESVSIRKLVLKRLARILSERFREFAEFLNSDSSSELLSELIPLLFACCQTEDFKIHSLVGECLSQIGALDPGRITLKSDSQQVPVLITEDSNFAHGLLQRIVNTFLSYNQHNDMQNKASYAIQELSKTYRLPDDRDLWNLFANHEQEVIKMLTSTKYNYKKVDHEKDQLPRPLFGGPHGKDFCSWINAWIKSLLPLVKDPTEHHVLDLCSLIASNDLSVAQYILPSLVSTVMVNASEEDITLIKGEVVSLNFYIRWRNLQGRGAFNFSKQ